MNTNEKITFSKNLQQLLKEKKKTQKELADFLNISPASVNKYIKGITYPRFDKINQIATFFEVNEADLIGVAELTEKVSTNYLIHLLSDDFKNDISNLLEEYNTSIWDAILDEKNPENLAIYRMFHYMDIEDKKKVVKTIVDLFSEYDGLDDNDLENIKKVNSWLSKKSKKSKTNPNQDNQ